MLCLARTRHRLFLQRQHLYPCNKTASAMQCTSHGTTLNASGAIAGSTEFRASGLCRTGHQAATDHTSSNYSAAAALAAGICAVSGCMAEQTSTACASTKGPPDDDPFEKTKKKVQEVSNIAIAQLGALVPDEWDHLKKRVNEVSASGKAGQVSWGCCTGLCAGFALKKASKVGAVAIGALLGLLYGACSLGYVNVDAEKLGRDFRRYLDIHQGGGVDTKDVDAMYKSVMKVLHSNLPAGSSFAVGFVLGFRSG